MAGGVLSPTELTDRLTDALVRLRAAAESADLTEGDHVLAPAMADLYELGRVVTVQPAQRAEADVILFLQESGRLLNRNHVLVERYTRRIEDVLRQGWEDGSEWEHAAIGRSALAFLDELYTGTAYEGFVEILELDELDRLLRIRTSEEGPPLTDPVAEGIPQSHWWWWPIADDDEPRP